MSDLPIKLAEDVLKAGNFKQVVVLGNDFDNINHIITYGHDKENCRLAGLAGDFWKDVLEWPDEKRSKYSKGLAVELLEALEHALNGYHIEGVTGSEDCRAKAHAVAKKAKEILFNEK